MSKPRNFTSWRLGILQAACADPAISATSFRLMSRVSAAANQHTGRAVLGDDLIRDEVVGFKGDGSVRKHRRAIEAAGYWQTEPGSGLAATVYIFSDRPVAAIVEMLKAAKAKRGKRRVERHSAVRAERQIPRETHGGSPVPPDGGMAPDKISSTPVPSDGGASLQQLQSKGRDEGGLRRRNTPVQPDGHTRSSFTSRSKKEASEREDPSYARTREKPFRADDFVSDRLADGFQLGEVRREGPLTIAGVRFCADGEIQIALIEIGDGDLQLGYRRAQHLSRQQLERLEWALSEAGADRSAAAIQAAKAAAIRLEQQAARRAER